MRVLRGFDGESRRIASEIRAQFLRAQVGAIDTPAALFATGAERAPDEHMCAYVQISGCGVEVDR